MDKNMHEISKGQRGFQGGRESHRQTEKPGAWFGGGRLWGSGTQHEVFVLFAIPTKMVVY